MLLGVDVLSTVPRIGQPVAVEDYMRANSIPTPFAAVNNTNAAVNSPMRQKPPMQQSAYSAPMNAGMAPPQQQQNQPPQYGNPNVPAQGYPQPSSNNGQQMPQQGMPANNTFKQPPPPQNNYGGNGFNSSNANQKPSSSSSANNNETITAIKNLNPYINKWTIKARVINKSDVRTWNNAKGEGKLFSVTFMDESGEIKATGFNDAVEKYHAMLTENSVYYVSKAQIKVARKQFSTVQNDFEMSFDKDTQIIQCNDGAADIPSIRYSFVDIARITDYPKDSVVDLIAVVKDVAEVQTFVAKTTQKQMTKRDLTLVDASMSAIKTTLWGAAAESFSDTSCPVIAFKGVRVSDFGGRTLSTFGGTSFSLNPDIPEAHKLRGWYDNGGRNAQCQNLSTGGGAAGAGQTDVRINIAQITDNQLGLGEKPDYFTIKASVIHIKSENISYTACPTEGCNKKVTEEGSSFRCEKCQRTFDHCDHRYILNMNVADFSGAAWLSGFNDSGELILGQTAAELNMLKENGNEEAYQAAFAKGLWKTYIFKCRAKGETYQDELKVRTSILNVMPVDYVAEANRLLQLIDEIRV